MVLTITDSLDKVHGHEDISWLYDTDFDALRDESVETVLIGGRRCYDLALRLILSGVAQEKLQLFPDYGELEQALIRQAPTEGTVAIFFELHASPLPWVCERRCQATRRCRHEKIIMEALYGEYSNLYGDRGNLLYVQEKCCAGQEWSLS